MVVMKIVGGLASQVSKYILGYAVAKLRNDPLVLYIGDYFDGYFRPFMLEYLTLPDVKCVSSLKGIRGFSTVSNGLSLNKEIENHRSKNIFIENENKDYDEFYSKYGDEIWKIENEILQSIELKYESEFLEQFKALIKKDYTVAIQVRRGDFVKLGLQDNIDAYKAIIGGIKKNKPGAKFVFFSNDIEWVHNEFGENMDFYYVNSRMGYVSDVEDMFAMSFCNLKVVSRNSGYGKMANSIGIAKYGFEKSITVDDNRTPKMGYYLYCDRNLCSLTKQQFDKGLRYFSLVYGNNSLKSRTNDKYEYNIITRREAVDLGVDREVKIRYWKKHYGINEVKYNHFIIVSDAKIDPWRFSGDYLKAIILARIGVNVSYIQLSYFNGSRDSFAERADDMDGHFLGFDVYHCCIWNIARLVSDLGENKRVGIKVSIGNRLISRITGIKENAGEKRCLFLSEIETENTIFGAHEDIAVKRVKKWI